MHSVLDPWELASVLDFADVGRSGLGLLLEISPLWLVGLLIGFLSPKQPLLSDFKSFLASCLGVALGLSAQSNVVLQAMMCLHGMVFIQTLWLRNTDPGTFHRYLESVLAAIAGTANEVGKPGVGKDILTERASDETEKAWYITDADLDFFRARVERQDAPIRAEPWQLMVDKAIPDVLRYRAYRRMLKDIRKTEYLSVSTTRNSTPHEVMDFYLSDPARQQWDSMLALAETIQNGDFSKRQQVVHWRRSFPFAFLSDRDYVIARQMFQDGDTLYGISKVVKHPHHDTGGAVEMETCWSMWSCRPATCPFGSGAPATETTLLHMEDFKIPENLSRFAVKAGMWGFIKKMSPHMQAFIEDRRARGGDPNARDPQAFGAPSSDSGTQDDHIVQAPVQRAVRLHSTLRKVACGAAAVVMIGLLGHGGDRRRRKDRDNNGVGVSV